MVPVHRSGLVEFVFAWEQHWFGLEKLIMASSIIIIHIISVSTHPSESKSLLRSIYYHEKKTITSLHVNFLYKRYFFS